MKSDRFVIIIAVILLSTSQIVVAESLKTRKGHFPNDEDLEVLPRYCKVKLKPEFRDTSEQKQYMIQFGRPFGHIHHYCAGLNAIRIAYAQPGNRLFFLDQAVKEISYVIEHSGDDNNYVPVFLVERGRLQEQLDRTQAAIQDFTKAMQLKPSYEQAHIALANFYSKKNLKANALEAVTEGLKNTPGSKSLQRKYTELGGQMPFPEPYRKKLDDTKNIKEMKKDEGILNPPQGSVIPKQDSSEEVPAKLMQSKPTISNEPPFGSKNNPWCRFCPEQNLPTPGKSEDNKK